MKEIVICECDSPEHQILFRTIDGDDDVYMTIHLAPLPFWKRLINGIKYIFGHRSKYGDFDEVIISPSESDAFYKVARYLNTEHNPIK